jgi:LmbE family N-acetylglucosaminyl deacetylase
VYPPPSDRPVLVVAAHPDDEILGAGATMARLAREGRPVHAAILGEGITSRYSDRREAPAEELEQLAATARKANEIVGTARVTLHELPDNRFDTVPLLDVVKIVEALVEEVDPEIVLTHDGSDLNVDHVIAHRAVMTATRGLEGQRVTEVLTFEIPSSTDWAYAQFAPAFAPNVFIDVTDTLDLKIAAMEAYESEARAFPHPRAPEALTAWARARGASAGLHAAEAFRLIRRIA